MHCETENNLQITPETLIPDLSRRHPQARPVFNRYGLNGCGGQWGPVESIGFFARTHGVDERQLMAELHEAAARGLDARAGEDSGPSVADATYRRFFTAGIVLVLTAGATWGAWLLWQIGIRGSFTSISIFHVNAHGHAQIFGWVGLFIMGFAYQAFPRMWHTYQTMAAGSCSSRTRARSSPAGSCRYRSATSAKAGWPTSIDRPR